MSLSRKLIEKLVNEECERVCIERGDLDVKRLQNLANQVFLIQSLQDDDSEIKSSLVNKIDHFHSIMEEGGIGE